LKKYVIGFLAGIIFATSTSVLAASTDLLATISSFNFVVNNVPKKLDSNPVVIDGSSYLPVKAVSEMLGYDVKYIDETRTINLTSKSGNSDSSAGNTGTNLGNKPVLKDLISKSDLPYTFDAKNDMSITINSYDISSNGISINLTLTNKSSVSDKGLVMTSTYEIYDGKNTLKFVDQDRIFYDTREIRAGQSITGNVKFKGLTQTTDKISLFGKLWQYINTEEFKFNFKVE
jgi:hypothetical protein